MLLTPKVFGYKLNERLGRYAFWMWLLGFMTAFIPLYVLGFMACYFLMRSRLHRYSNWDTNKLSDLLFYGALGVILGGRLGESRLGRHGQRGQFTTMNRA